MGSQEAAVIICVPSVSPSCCLLGGSLRSASGSDPGFFQITDSSMGLEVCNIWHSFFESGVCSVEPSDPLYASSTVLQIQTFWGLIFQVQDSWDAESNVGLRPPLF